MAPKVNKFWQLALFIGFFVTHPIYLNASQDASDNSNYTWYDGKRERTVLLVPNLVADFSPESIQSIGLKENFPKARLQSKYSHRIRIWKLPKHLHALKAVQKVQNDYPNENYSPVFQDGENGEGSKRALPGNVIVTVNPKWSEAEINQWASRHHLVVLKKLQNNPHVLLIQSSPGLKSLKVANDLFESGEVVAATPNWWKESTTR